MRNIAIASFAHTFHEYYLLSNIIHKILTPAVITKEMSTRGWIIFYFITVAASTINTFRVIWHWDRIIPYMKFLLIIYIVWVFVFLVSRIFMFTLLAFNILIVVDLFMYFIDWFLILFLKHLLRPVLKFVDEQASIKVQTRNVLNFGHSFH